MDAPGGPHADSAQRSRSTGRSEERTVGAFVDFDLGARLAARLVPPGPAAGREEVADVVGALREAAAEAAGPVSATARLHRDPALAPEPPALVVDRASWARANVEAFRALLEPVVVPLPPAGRTARPGGRADRAATAVGRRTTGGEVGTLLAFLSSRVLGQFDVFSGVDSGGPGRLLLVAPNVLQTERDLRVVPADFRRWVCLHEEAHRLQFGANPWLRRWVTDQARELSADLLAQPRDLAERFGGVVRGLPDLLRGEQGSGAGVADLLQTPGQRERVRRLVAVMSLLEGHADVVMDDVGPQVVPTVATIRARFTERRRGRGSLDQVVRRLLGLDAKTRQYADGARFVRGVLREVGWDGLNVVWSGPGSLPSPEEVADPGAWVRRVHG
ncbi:zinc-dependent metalloprotease [Paenibacillus sp. TRM 82003]|uniref:zinc-dependent metalloprotease n=1 Tax=Kineococcus sp. TRM81007 TaxID=2925831 RepID=UPI001F5A4607|nr:zinc-dependent metalloprotease [Kineococcus sp. TRM81007]MCI2239460.1 zinc-dependent metalloprotease [Kineococcus sp. TRM81007]MCI3919260.1 zinc-dependent metalloprotease [Paenibacillus sp. TRM 82003]